MCAFYTFCNKMPDFLIHLDHCLLLFAFSIFIRGFGMLCGEFLYITTA